MVVSVLLHVDLFKALLCKMLLENPPVSIHSDRIFIYIIYMVKHILTCSNNWTLIACHLSPDLF